MRASLCENNTKQTLQRRKVASHARRELMMKLFGVSSVCTLTVLKSDKTKVLIHVIATDKKKTLDFELCESRYLEAHVGCRS